MRNWLITTERKQPHYYRGLLIHADEGVHEDVAELLTQAVGAPATVADIGAGAGALSRRLHDAGYDVTAVDVDADKWLAHEVPFRVLDVKSGLAKALDPPYDAACCLEVIEHVEDQWALMRELRAIVRPGGTVIVSTPNTTSFLSRLLFLLRGRFHQFDEVDLSYGHIAPITSFELEHIATSVGLRVEAVRSSGYLPVFDISEPSAKGVALNVLRGLAYLLSRRGHRSGWVLLYAFVRDEDATSGAAKTS